MLYDIASAVGISSVRLLNILHKYFGMKKLSHKTVVVTAHSVTKNKILFQVWFAAVSEESTGFLSSFPNSRRNMATPKEEKTVPTAGKVMAIVNIKE